MKNTKLLSVFRTFQKDDWSSYRRHLLKYVREDSDIFKIFEYFQTRKSKLASIDEPAIVVSKHFYWLTVKIFLNHMSSLFQYVEEWMVHQQLKKERYNYDLILLKALNARGLYNLANQTHHKIERVISGHPAHDLEKSKAKSTLLHYQYYSNNPIKYERGAPLLQDLVEAYISWFKDQSLLYSVEMESWGKIQEFDFSKSTKLIHEMASEINDSEISQDLRTLYELVLDKEVEPLFILREKLLNGHFQKGSELHNFITGYLIQRSIKLWNKGLLKDKSIVIESHLYGIESGALMENGTIGDITFVNIIGTLSSFESYSKVNVFITSYINFTAPENREAIKDLCIAYNCFSHEKYGEILEYTRRTDYGLITNKLLALRLELVSLFMNRHNNYDIFINHIVNLKDWLKRNKGKISFHNYMSNINIIDFMTRIDKASRKNDIEINLNEYKFLAHRNWCNVILEKEVKAGRVKLPAFKE